MPSLAPRLLGEILNLGRIIGDKPIASYYVRFFVTESPNPQPSLSTPMTSPIANAFVNLYIFSSDLVYTVANLVSPKFKVGSVIAPGQPGAGGEWPEYVAPKEGDSRCCCPALNALANHGECS